MAQKIKNKVDKQSIDHYLESFKLLRRFRNFLRKDVVSFQQIRLLYMAFSKAAIEKKLDADSKYYDLYKQTNDAVVKMYRKADQKKEEYKDSGFNIVNTKSDIYQKIDELIKSKQIDIGVRLVKRFVNMINTKPDKAKAKRLLTSIDNAIKNKQLMNDNRLYQEVIHAKEELQDYLNTDDALEVVDYVGSENGEKSNKKGKNKSIKEEGYNKIRKMSYPELPNKSWKYDKSVKKYGTLFASGQKQILKLTFNDYEYRKKYLVTYTNLSEEDELKKPFDKFDDAIKYYKEMILNIRSNTKDKSKKESSSNQKLKDDILATAKKYGIRPKGMSAPTYNGHQVLQAHEIGMMAPAEIIPGMNGSKSVEQAVNSLILDRIKTGKELPPWKKSWAAQSNEKAKNYFSGTVYSGSNSLILNGLLASVMKTPYYGTLNQINEAGGKVKNTKDYIPLILYEFQFRLRQFNDNNNKKQNLLSKVKGQKIRKNIKGKLKDITINEKNYSSIRYTENQINKFIKNGVTKDEYYKTGFVKYFRVYNLANTTGIDYKLPEPKQLNKGQRIANAEALLKSFTDKPPIKEDTKQAYYIPKKDEVYTPKITQFDSEEEYYSTLFHELIHSTMHKSRLNREKDYKGKKEGASRAFEELIAELGASFLCGEVGILNVVHLNSAAYLKNWHQKLQEQTGKYEDFFIYATREAKKAADYILKNYEPVTTTKSDDKSDKSSSNKSKEKDKARARARARARIIKMKNQK